MKALLRKEFYISGGRKALLTAAAATPFMILLNWSGIAAVYALLLCLLPLTIRIKDDSARWWTYAKTLPYSRNQIVDAKYLFQLLLILIFGLMLVLERFASALLFPDKPLSSQYAEYLFFLPCFLSALSFPMVFWGKRHGQNWLSHTVFALIWIVAMTISLMGLPALLLTISQIDVSPGIITDTYILIGNRRFTSDELLRFWAVFKWILPSVSMALYGVSWLLSRKIFRLRRHRRIPAEYPPRRSNAQEDEEAIAVMMNMFWN